MKSESEFINYHLNRIRKIQTSVNNKRIFVECFPTDDNAICLPNSNFSVKEIFFDADESASLPSSSVTGEESWKEVIINRISEFQKIYHANEAGRLTLALKAIEELIPPSYFESLPVTGEEWKEKFKDWLVNNMQFTSKSNVQIIADHVERYIVKSSPVTRESEAIGMIKWIRENYEPEFGDGRHWEDILDEAETPISDKELYNLYKQSKK